MSLKVLTQSLRQESCPFSMHHPLLLCPFAMRHPSSCHTMPLHHMPALLCRAFIMHHHPSSCLCRAPSLCTAFASPCCATLAASPLVMCYLCCCSVVLCLCHMSPDTVTLFIFSLSLFHSLTAPLLSHVHGTHSHLPLCHVSLHRPLFL